MRTNAFMHPLCLVSKKCPLNKLAKAMNGCLLIDIDGYFLGN